MKSHDTRLLGGGPVNILRGNYRCEGNWFHTFSRVVYVSLNGSYLSCINSNVAFYFNEGTTTLGWLGYPITWTHWLEYWHPHNEMLDIRNIFITKQSFIFQFQHKNDDLNFYDITKLHKTISNSTCTGLMSPIYWWVIYIEFLFYVSFYLVSWYNFFNINLFDNIVNASKTLNNMTMFV